MSGNIPTAPFSWTFGVQEHICGQAEFYGIETSSVASAFIVNAQTPLASGFTVTAYNPTHEDLSWIENTRIKSITLLYRKVGSSNWLVALDIKGNPAAFYDDVRARTWFLNCA